MRDERLDQEHRRRSECLDGFHVRGCALRRERAHRAPVRVCVSPATRLSVGGHHGFPLRPSAAPLRRSSNSNDDCMKEGKDMTRKLAVFAAVLALGAMTWGTTLTGASAGTSEELRFRAITTEATNLDLGDPGLSQGDEFIFHDVLRHEGERIGHDGGVCTVTSVKGPELQCLVTISLSGGDITIQGLAREGEVFVFAVTGGTGQYQGASGEARVEVRSDTVARVTIDLVA
jgi:allene oxide cyclase-like protein